MDNRIILTDKRGKNDPYVKFEYQFLKNRGLISNYYRKPGTMEYKPVGNTWGWVMCDDKDDMMDKVVDMIISARDDIINKKIKKKELAKDIMDMTGYGKSKVHNLINDYVG